MIEWNDWESKKPPTDGTPFMVYCALPDDVGDYTLKFMQEMDVLEKGRSRYIIVWMGKDGHYQPWTNSTLMKWTHWAALSPPALALVAGRT